VSSLRRVSHSQATQQLFHALVNRAQAYDYANQLGLICFGSEVSRTCELTPLYERFRDRVDGMRTDGDTKLWDAIAQARRTRRAGFARVLLPIFVAVFTVDSR
jgi:Mg-chelatase subunit ChlD